VFHSRISYVVSIAVMALTACAGAPERPTAEFSRAQTMIQTAEQQGAQEFAGVELERARGKLRQAETEANEGDTEQSERLAQQAAIDAELAAAKSAAAKARKAADELERSLETLRNEAARGQTPPSD
jgi:flagellar biosynthesis component FlhA